MSGEHSSQDSVEPGDSGEPMFLVVRNDEEQYSIWPADRELPAGWEQAGPRAARSACLAYIEENWSDIRPLSVRRRLAEQD